MSEDDATVVVVGAGPTGAVVAGQLAKGGIDVLCLERGTDPPPAPDPRLWELAGRGWMTENPTVRAGGSDYPIDDSGSEIKPMIWNGVGGGSILWGAQWERFLPSDFRVRTLDGVADDWPLRYEDLAPYYDQLDRDFGISALPGDPAFPDGGDPRYPPLRLPPVAMRVARAHNELGWHWWPGPNAITPACTMRGSCATGCPEGAKLTVDRSHWPAAIRAGARLRTGAAAVSIETAGGLARSVLWVDLDGHEHRSRAEVVVLAAGAIGSSRLLLASADAHHPDGLANGSGLVGRRLMLHPFTRVIGLFEDDDLATANGPWGQMLHCLEFAESDPGEGRVRGTKWNLGPSGGPLTAALAGSPDATRCAGTAAWVRAVTGRAGVWGITADDLPHEANRVELDPVRRDRAGTPGVCVYYRVSEAAQGLLDDAAPRAQASFEAAGAVRTVAYRRLANFGWHQMGTARMGTDPEHSVVDSDNRCHEVPNLLIADASVFVTGSSVNPTATACALALRAAERLQQCGVVHRRRGERPGPGPARAQTIDSMVPPGAWLNRRRRALLAALGALLIPAEAGIPGAGEAGIELELIDTVLTYVPRLEPAVRAALELCEQAESPQEWLAAEPAELEALFEAVAAAWSISPAVREVLGYRGAYPRAGDDLSDAAELASVVRLRGASWRGVDG